MSRIKDALFGDLNDHDKWWQFENEFYIKEEKRENQREPRENYTRLTEGTVGNNIRGQGCKQPILQK